MFDDAIKSHVVTDLTKKMALSPQGMEIGMLSRESTDMRGRSAPARKSNDNRLSQGPAMRGCSSDYKRLGLAREDALRCA